MFALAEAGLWPDLDGNALQCLELAQHGEWEFILSPCPGHLRKVLLGPGPWCLCFHFPLPFVLFPLSLVFLSLPPSAPLPMQHYFCDAWNTFDALIVVGSIVDIAITEVNVSTGVPPCDAVPASRSPPSLSFASCPPPSSFLSVILICLFKLV